MLSCNSSELNKIDENNEQKISEKEGGKGFNYIYMHRLNLKFSFFQIFHMTD